MSGESTNLIYEEVCTVCLGHSELIQIEYDLNTIRKIKNQTRSKR